MNTLLTLNHSKLHPNGILMLRIAKNIFTDVQIFQTILKNGLFPQVFQVDITEETEKALMYFFVKNQDQNYTEELF